MIKQMTWLELMTENNVGNYALDQNGLKALIEEVDYLFTKSYRETTGSSDNDKRLTNIYLDIINHYTSTSETGVNENYWKDMPIYVSSYNYRLKAPFGEVILRLTQYLGFYKKILTDKGLARSVVTHRDYRNAGHSEGTNKNTNSETPQIETDFDDIIKYASSLTKNEDETESSTWGDSDLSVESKSWEEEEKNLKLVFYNDLCDYIKRIPQWLYSQYALDCLPAKAIVEETFKYFKELYERR